MKFYSDVKYFENDELGGGIHVCTTEYKLLLNLNDIFDLLDLEKPLRRRWKSNIEFDDINFKRNNIGVYESFVDTETTNALLNLYGKEIMKNIKRKNSVERQILLILNEYGDTNIHIEYGDGSDLAYEFALDTLKTWSEFHGNELYDVIKTIEEYPYKKKPRPLGNLYQFDIESKKEEPKFKSYDELLNEVMDELKNQKQSNNTINN